MNIMHTFNLKKKKKADEINIAKSGSGQLIISKFTDSKQQCQKNRITKEDTAKTCISMEIHKQ